MKELDMYVPKGIKEAILINTADLERFEPLRDGLLGIGVQLITDNAVESGRFIAIGEISSALAKELGQGFNP